MGRQDKCEPETLVQMFGWSVSPSKVSWDETVSGEISPY